MNDFLVDFCHLGRKVSWMLLGDVQLNSASHSPEKHDGPKRIAVDYINPILKQGYLGDNYLVHLSSKGKELF